MEEQYKIYMDVCCLNRPFDDWTQPRIRLEAEAVLAIASECQANTWQLVSSTALGYVDAVRFIKQFDSGTGNYTRDRHQWLDALSLDDIWAELQGQQLPTESSRVDNSSA